MKEKTTIQVLLATYNGERFLREQLDSIFAQQGVVVSIIARDDGSTDGTKAILAEYETRHTGRLQVLESEDRLGAMGSFFALMQAASADYIAFADQDDVWLADKLITLLQRLQGLERKHGGSTPLLVHCDLDVVDVGLNRIAASFWQHSGIFPERNALPQLLFQNTVTGCATLFNRALLQSALPVREGIVMHDHWLALHAITFGAIGVEPRALVRYRQHGGNAVGAQVNWRQLLLRQIMLLLRTGAMHHDWHKLLVQPGAFFRANRARLPEAVTNLLVACLSLEHRPYFSRVWLLFKWKLGPAGRIRRIVFRLRA